jgi:hypothetical protein
MLVVVVVGGFKNPNTGLMVIKEDRMIYCRHFFYIQTYPFELLDEVESEFAFIENPHGEEVQFSLT